MATQSATVIVEILPIDVDDLAREKVQEVEDVLDNNKDVTTFDIDSIRSCFSILKQIITAADLHRTNDKEDKSENHQQNNTNHNSESIYADYADDYEQFNTVDLTEQFATNSVKWTIRVRAFKSVHRIFTLLTSIKLASNKITSVLFKILPDLIRLSFVAATSPYDDLKIQGFQMFRELINRFASVEEKEFPGHSILEQYKSQVLTALKPAFNLDAPPYITAIACQVCSQWICRGLEKDSIGLKRAYQLMEPSIEKLESQSTNPNSLLYQELELEQERLDILGSWAYLYTTSHETGETAKSLDDLIKYRVETLVGKWWEALKDYALLIMLSPKTMAVSHDNEHVYTREVALKLFTPTWPRLALAVTIWLCGSTIDSKNSSNNSNTENEPVENTKTKKTDNALKYFRFLCGILMSEFCKCSQLESTTDSLPESAVMSLRSLHMLLSSDKTNKGLLDEITVAREFYVTLGGTLMKMTNLKSSHISLLKTTLSQIFRLILTKFKDNDRIVQFSLAQLMRCLQVEIEEPGINSHDVKQTSQQLIFSNLIAVAKSRPDLLSSDPGLIDELTNITSKILAEDSNLPTTILIIDSVQNLQRNLDETSLITVIKRMSAAKQSLLLKLINVPSIEKPLAQRSESRLFFEVIIKSMKVDLELLEGSERRSVLVSLIRTLASNLDPSIDDKDLVYQITQVLKDLERTFVEDFAAIRESDLKTMIGKVLKPISKDAKDSKTTKKNSNSNKKPSSTIVLKSDFSNFYSKK